MNSAVTVATLGSFLALNGMQAKIPAKAIVPLNLLVCMLPQIAFIIKEFAFCKSMGDAPPTIRAKIMQKVQIVPMLLLPLMVFYVAGSPALHDKICSGLHKMEFSSMTASSARVNANKFDTQKIIAAANAAQQRAKEYLQKSATWAGNAEKYL